MAGDVGFVEIRDPLPGELAPGRNDTLRVAVDTDGRRWILRRGPDEAFAYALSQRYFAGVVPTTVMVRRYGTAQEMIDGRTALDAGQSLLDAVRSSREALAGLAGMACLDLVMGNKDRHSNNWGLSRDGRVWAWDNEVTGEPVRLRQCMRPIYRCVLADDPDFTPAVIDEMERMLEVFLRDCESPAAERALSDVRDWRSDLRAFRGQ